MDSSQISSGTPRGFRASGTGAVDDTGILCILFYGGMVRSRNVLKHDDDEFPWYRHRRCSMVIYGYSMTFGNSVKGWGIVGDPTEFSGQQTYVPDAVTGTIPTFAFRRFSNNVRCDRCRTHLWGNRRPGKI